MTADIGFSIKGAGKIIPFFFCSFILIFCLRILSALALLGITFLSTPWDFLWPWIIMFLDAILKFVVYLISGLMLRLCMKNLSMLLYFLVAVIYGIAHYLLFGFEPLYSDSVYEIYIHIQLIFCVAPVLGVFLGSVFIGNLLVAKIDLENMLPNIMKGFALVVLICVGYAWLAKEFDSELYVTNNNLFSRIVEHMLQEENEH